MTVRPDLVEFVDLAALAGFRPEHVGGVVEQRHVAGGPTHVVERPRTRPEERQCLTLVDRPAGRHLQQRLGAEQVVEQLGRREQRPHPIECLAGLRCAAQHVLDLARTDLGIVERSRERRPELALDEPSAAVVTAEPTPRSLDDARRLVDAQPYVAGAERDDEVVPQRPLAVADRIVDDVGHAVVALEAGGHRRVVAVCPGPEERDVGNQVGEHDLLHAGLAERRQHPLDVAEEDPIRPDDEHSLIFEREPVGVEEVRRPVERDDGLAGAGTALHDEHSVLGRSDDLVLLTLDGGDDVAERAGATALERGEQRRVAAQPVWPISVEPFVVAETEVALAEEFVLDAEERAALDDEVATPGEAHRVAAGGAVERLRDRRPPVDHDGLAVLVGDREAPDVEVLQRVGRLGVPVDPPEHE